MAPSNRVERYMSKTGRNQPCPCGSGKKYKTCCLRKDEDAQRQVERAALPPAGRPSRDPREDDGLELLDSRSNRVIDLIDEGRLDEAEAASHELLSLYPDLMDGHLRLAMVCEARQQPELAAGHYRRAAACLEEDSELRADFLRQANKLAPAV
ncbi:MAG: SEC-C domain-containing protein [Polyangiaceae bacterium]|nr:SEC-C domain-containing protein [Polyangiaceae bacterium]